MKTELVMGGVEQLKAKFEQLSTAGKRIYICVEVIAGYWLLQVES